jgi:very-short-patch-repair endonuclease
MHEAFILNHLSKRMGERRRRLKEGHGHAEALFLEQVWIPAFGQLDYLHPEYEIQDFRDGSRFVDFAYIRPSLKLAIEIDGYGPHARLLSRVQFSDQLTRQNHLVIDGWRVLRFSYDDVKDRPRACEQVLQQLLGRFMQGKPSGLGRTLKVEEREILRHAIRIARPITLNDVFELLQAKRDKVRQLLYGLVERGLLISSGQGRLRRHSYTLAKEIDLDDLWW